MSNQSFVPELSPFAGKQSFDMFKADFPEHTTEELLAAFEERLQDCADTLIDTYGSPARGQDERRKALLEYGAVVMAKHGLLYRVSHNPYGEPTWLSFGRSDLIARTEDGSEQRRIAERTPIFSDDERTQRSLGEMVSASLIPQGEYTCTELANGLVSNRVTVQPF